MPVAGGLVTAKDTPSPVSSVEADAHPEIAVCGRLVLSGMVATKRGAAKFVM